MSTIEIQDHQQDFWHKRYFKVIVGYFVGSWTFLEFLSFILSRFHISPYWSDVFLHLLLFFIPAILIISFAPRVGKRPVVLMRRWIVPINLLVAILITTFLFWGKDLGATTKTVYYQDENGLDQPVVVQKEEFATKILFEGLVLSDSLNEENKWLTSSLRKGIGFSLKQVREIYLNSTYEKDNLKEILDELKYENFDYYLSGVISTQSDTIFLDFTITKKDGKQLLLDKIGDTNPIALIDKVTEALLIKLDIHPDTVPLPFKEFGTNNQEAFEAWGNGDVTGALELDSTFLLAWGDKLFISIYQQADQKFLNRIAETSVKYINKLPERLQGSFKTLYWYALREYGKCESSIERYMKLDPTDENLLDQKVFLHTYMGNIDKAAEAIEVQLERNFNEQNLIMALNDYLMLNSPDRMMALLVRYGDQMNALRKAIVEAFIALQLQDYELALEKSEEMDLIDPSNQFSKEFRRVVRFEQQISKSKRDSIYQAVSGFLIVDNAKQKIKFSYDNGQLLFMIRGYPIGLIKPISEDSLSFISVINNAVDFFAINRNQNGEVYKLNDSRKRSLFRITNGLGEALEYFEKKDYLKSDSLFRLEKVRSPETYFIENYLNAINYQLGEDKKLLDDLEGMKLVRPNGEFVCIILRVDDFLEFEFNGSVNRVYPISNDWLVNLDSRRNKYNVFRTPDGVKMDRYEWDPKQNDYVKKNTYVEFREAL